MSKDTGPTQLTFWEHLDALRTTIIRIAVIVVVYSVVLFCCKDFLFRVILAPKDADFVTYRLFNLIAPLTQQGGTEAFHVELINTALAGQFLTHMKVAIYAGILCASPYILYQLFRFVSPALYADERRYAVRVVGFGYLLFLAGVLVSYFLIFPFTFRFLGTYQVSAAVGNLITLESYISTFTLLSLSLGIVFEMPMLCWLFAKLGFITADFMRRYRRHAIVVILIIAAIITPTSDVFTLMLVSLPMYMLYEVSIIIVRATRSPRPGASDKMSDFAD